jgi:hypothetical protein
LVPALYKLASYFGLLCAAACILGGGARAADAKVSLVRDAVVNGKSIYLSDLLPESSPGTVRILAQEILIGKSPQPGGSRILSSDEIVRLLSDANLSSQVGAPAQITVHRSGHLVTREEVAEAIRRSQSGSIGSMQVSPDEIRLNARVTTLTEDADLRVTRTELDPTMHELKFWLVSGAQPTLPTFMAMIQTKCASCGSQSNLGTQAPKKPYGGRSGSGGHANPGPAFVEQGKAANLHMIYGAEMQMDLTAISLERGSLGQTVRVKIKETGKILDAHVVGHNQLEAEF